MEKKYQIKYFIQYNIDYNNTLYISFIKVSFKHKHQTNIAFLVLSEF